LAALRVAAASAADCFFRSLLLELVLCAWFVSEQHVLLSAQSCVDRVTTVSCTNESTGCYD